MCETVLAWAKRDSWPTGLMVLTLNESKGASLLQLCAVLLVKCSTVVI